MGAAGLPWETSFTVREWTGCAAPAERASAGVEWEGNGRGRQVEPRCGGRQDASCSPFPRESTSMEHTHEPRNKYQSASPCHLGGHSPATDCSVSDEACLGLKWKLGFISLPPGDSGKEKAASWAIVGKELIWWLVAIGEEAPLPQRTAVSVLQRTAVSVLWAGGLCH